MAQVIEINDGDTVNVIEVQLPYYGGASAKLEFGGRATQTLAKGDVVYVSGANGTHILVTKAQANSEATSAGTIGLATSAASTNADLQIITFGLQSGLDTSAYTAGQVLYLSPSVAGGLTSTFPAAPNHGVKIGWVVRSHPSLGQIFVEIQNYQELDELSDVNVTSKSDGQVLTWNAATSTWIAATPNPGDITAVNVTAPISGGGTSGSVTIGHANSGVTAATYGTADSVPQVAVNATGHVTSAANVSIAVQQSAVSGLTNDLNTMRQYCADGSVLTNVPARIHPAEQLLKQAVFWIDAAQSAASAQTITNLGWGGSALNAQAGSSGSADSNDPRYLDWSGANYVYIPGVNSNYLSVPDAASFDITGNIDLRVYCAFDSATPASCALLSKRAINDLSYSINMSAAGAGRLRFAYSTDGVTYLSADSTVAATITADVAQWYRATRNVTTGDVIFYTSPDGITWTQLGTTVSTSAGNHWSGAAPIEVGSDRSGIGTMTGKVFRAQVLNGINGTPVLDVDTSVIASGNATSFTANTGQTVTINRATSGRKTTVVTHPVWLFGLDDYITIADNDLLDFGASDSFTLLYLRRTWATPGTFQTDVTKGSSGASYQFYHWNANTMYFDISDGTNQARNQPASTIVYGTLYNFAAVVDRSAQTLVQYWNGTSVGSVSTSTVGSPSNSQPLELMRNKDGEMYAAALFRRALTAAEIATLTTYYQGRVG